MTPASIDAVIDREALNFPFGATLVCVTARMNESLAASLRRVANAGHSVTVVALADEDWSADLGRIRIYNISGALQALEARSFQRNGSGNGAHL
jgi:hypothetical protein